VVGTAPLVPAAAGLSFLNSSNPEIPAGAGLAAVGDFNRDGIPDLAVINGDSRVTILLGNGDGTFTATAVSPATGYMPVSIAVGDFNGDGNLDLAVANIGSNKLTILLGNGDGTFTATASPATGEDPEYIVVGDFNGDGIADLAVTNARSSTVTILLGNGDGTFTPAASPPTGEEPVYIVVGDFNGDGIPDLAVANVGENTSSSDTLTILLGNGDGTFTATASPAANIPSGLATADFNGDGIIDLAVPNQGSGIVTILLGNGDGTFTATTNPPEIYGGSITAGDFNGDGYIDLALISFIPGSGQSSLTVLLGDGHGNFTAAGPASGTYNSIATADFNGDGLADLAVVNYSTATASGDNMTILLSQSQMATAIVIGVSPAGAGTHLVDASYPGDSNYGSSISGTVSLTAEGLTPRMTLSSSSNSVNQGSPVTFTATVIATAPPPKAALRKKPSTTPPVPTGTMTFYSGTTSLGSISLNSSGQAIFATSSLPAGTDSITASYSGDKNYNPATSAAVTVTVIGKPIPTVKLTASSSSTTYGTLITFKASLTGNGAVPTGSVAFLSGVTLLGSANLNSSGVATYATSKAPAGDDSITASYSGDSNYGATNSTAVSITVAKAMLTVSANDLTMVYGAKLPALTYALSGFVNGDTAATATSGTPSLTTTATAKSTAGIYPITASVGTLAAANYSFAFKNGTLTIVAAPSVTTEAATSLTTTGAELHGSVTANDSTTKYWFAYGTSASALTRTTSKTGALTGTKATAVSAKLSGLKAKTVYYYQMNASNAAGSALGAVLSFTSK